MFPGKLRSRWSGPFVVKEVFPYGTVEIEAEDGRSWKVNGQRLKHYVVGTVDHRETEVLFLDTGDGIRQIRGEVLDPSLVST